MSGLKNALEYLLEATFKILGKENPYQNDDYEDDYYDDDY